MDQMSEDRMVVLGPHAWPDPLFTNDEICEMRGALMEHFRPTEVQSLPLMDLWELYRELRRG